MKLKMIKMEILLHLLEKKVFQIIKIKENYDAIKQTILKEKPNGIKGDLSYLPF